MAGGGVHGRVAGIAHGIIAEAGVIMGVFQPSIMTLTQSGEYTTGTVTGTGTRGTMNGLITDISTRTGSSGTTIDIGKGKECGEFKAISPDHNNRDRN
jgi:hypothetical protein